MRVKDWLKYTLKVIFTSECWLQNHMYNKEWDNELHELLLSGTEFEIICDYTARIGSRVVWIANHPYASFTISGDITLRPSRKVIMMAQDRLIESRIKSTLSRNNS